MENWDAPSLEDWKPTAVPLSVEILTPLLPVEVFEKIKEFVKIKRSYNLLDGKNQVWFIEFKDYGRFIEAGGFTNVKQGPIRIKTVGKNALEIQEEQVTDEAVILVIGINSDSENRFLKKRRYTIPLVDLNNIIAFMATKSSTSSSEIARKVFGVKNKRADATFDDRLNVMLRYLRDISGKIEYKKNGKCWLLQTDFKSASIWNGVIT